MSEIVTVILPVFGLLLAGFLAGKLGYLSMATAEGLSDYIYRIAVPVLLFQTIVKAEFPSLFPWTFWSSYFVPVFLCWGLIGILARKYFRRSAQEASIIGFATGQANTVLIGIPLILTQFGDEALVPIALLISIHLIIMMGAVTVMIELWDEGSEQKKKLLKRVASKLLSHPILVGIFLGLLFRLSGFEMGAVFGQLIGLIAKTAIPTALLAMGLSLNSYNIGAETKLVGLATIIKLILHPALVWIMAIYVFDLPPVWSATLVLFAACPSGINGYIVAKAYGKSEATTSSMITISTALSFITVSAWLILLDIQLN